MNSIKDININLQIINQRIHDLMVISIVAWTSITLLVAVALLTP